VLPPGREAGVPIEGQSGSLAGEAQIPATDQHEMFDPTPPRSPSAVAAAWDAGPRRSGSRRGWW
jgi:hypothetical protein